MLLGLVPYPSWCDSLVEPLYSRFVFILSKLLCVFRLSLSFDIKVDFLLVKLFGLLVFLVKVHVVEQTIFPGGLVEFMLSEIIMGFGHYLFLTFFDFVLN
jgi:hypothetical protein